MSRRAVELGGEVVYKFVESLQPFTDASRCGLCSNHFFLSSSASGGTKISRRKPFHLDLLGALYSMYFIHELWYDVSRYVLSQFSEIASSCSPKPR